MLLALYGSLLGSLGVAVVVNIILDSNPLESFNIFDFILKFGEIVFNWCGQLYGVLTYQLEIDLRPLIDFYFNVEIWQILGVGGIAIFLIVKIVKAFF